MLGAHIAASDRIGWLHDLCHDTFHHPAFPRTVPRPSRVSGPMMWAISSSRVTRHLRRHSTRVGVSGHAVLSV